jgi:hypothetical protein
VFEKYKRRHSKKGVKIKMNIVKIWLEPMLHAQWAKGWTLIQEVIVPNHDVTFFFAQSIP